MNNYLEIIASGEVDKIKKIFEENRTKIEDQETAISQYDVSQHDVMSTTKRPDKTIFRPDIDESTGEAKINETTGKPKTTKGIAPVNRVPLPFQKIIVKRRVAFMLGNPVKYDITYNQENKSEKAIVDYVYHIEDSAKTIYKNKELARRVMSEMECAELWYLDEIKDEAAWADISKTLGVKKPAYELKMKILAPTLGDQLYPLFDQYGDMVSFARGYKVKESDKEIDHFDVYTADFTYKYANRGKWALDETAPAGGKIPNLAKKIPVIYYTQPAPEWADVQGMIDRIEKILSNHSDMNDYFGEPILAIFGELIQAIGKGESGKILQLSEESKASFLALDSPPESIKMEVENLEKFIYAMSQTPNIAFSEMKSLGDLSGVALELMFLDAHLAVLSKEETFGIGIQRRINLLKAFIGNVLDISLAKVMASVRIKPVFTPYMPSNTKELVELISQSAFNEILSRRTAVEKFEDIGFISDATQEMKRIEEEMKQRSQANSLIGANTAE